MEESRRLIETIPDEIESKFAQQVPRRHVLGMMTGKKPLRTDRRERVIDHSPARFGSVSVAPKFFPQMHAKFVHIHFVLIRTQAAAAGMSAVIQLKDRPVLNIRFCGHCNLTLEPSANFAP